MDKRRIGSLEVPVVGLGCNNFGRRIDEPASARVVHAALDAGVNFFDTADIYGGTRSEEFLGRALAGRRDQAIIATKFGMAVDAGRQGARPDYIRRAVEDSLRRLGTDRIDLYQLHKPDPETPIADTLGALDELVRAGKVREIGCSNFSVAQLRQAQQAVAPGAACFASVQNEYSLLHREPEAGMLAECARGGVAFLPYFPLANGLLSGRFRRGEAAPEGSRFVAGAWGHKSWNDANLARVEALRHFAAARGRSLLELAFSWLLVHPAVASVIAGASRPEQVQANAAAAGWKLGSEDLAEVERLLAAA
ncbi:MAG TPA: aldo/keto reductase [Nevskia sp.]|nr:aldo/keto reductase [Nevskia sp.]